MIYPPNLILFGMRYVIASDFFIDDFIGGAALNDEEIFKTLLSKGEDVTKIKNRNITKEFLEKEQNSLFILSNFFHLSPELLEKLQKKCKYILYAHDYKFVEHTNPAKYEGFKVPTDELINIEVHENAQAVICQSNFQKEIYDKNLKSNTINFSGNLWSKESLDLMETLIHTSKNGRCSVVKSPYFQKGVPEAIAECIKRGFDYDLIFDTHYETFLRKLASNKALMFIPSTPETFSRICVEAKMMSVKVFHTELVGAAREPWFANAHGKEVIEEMRKCHNRAYDLIKSF